MRITKLILIFLLLAAFFVPWLSAEIKNPDKPEKGEWDFKLEKVWHINGAGDAGFARVNQLKIADNGRVYAHDGKMKKYYVFSPEGKLISPFGKEGEGPGEIKWIQQARMFPIKDRLLIADSHSIHYFSENGKYLRSVRNTYFQRRPSLFLSEDEFLSAPLLMADPKGRDAKIRLYNLKTDEEKVVTEFSVYKGGVARQGGMVVAMVIGGVTPMMVMGYHDGRVYYGMNDNYMITVSDMTGKAVTSFSLDREAKIVPKRVKEEMLKQGGNAPKEMMEQIVKGMPDKQTFFDGIEVHDGLIYVFLSQLEEGNSRTLDIFSPEGKYLYRAKVTVEENYKITSPPVIKNGFMYLVLEDEEEEEIGVAKYKIASPSIKP